MSNLFQDKMASLNLALHLCLDEEGNEHGLDTIMVDADDNAVGEHKNGVTLGLESLHPNLGTGAGYDGDTQHSVVEDSSALQGWDDFTIVFFIRTHTWPESTSSSNYRYLLSVWDDSDSWKRVWAVALHRDYLFIRLSRGDSTSTSNMTSQAISKDLLDDGNWHMVAIRRRQGQVEYFVDGGYCGNSSTYNYTLVDEAEVPLVLGNWAQLNQGADVDLDEVGLADYAINDRDLRELWEAAQKSLPQLSEGTTVYTVDRRRQEAAYETQAQTGSYIASAPRYSTTDLEAIHVPTSGPPVGLFGHHGFNVPAIRVGDLDEIAGWYEARHTGGTDGSTFFTWNDRSGRGVNLTMSTTSGRATYRTDGINGHPIAEFDSNDRYNSNSSQRSPMTGNHPRTIFAVIRNSGNQSSYMSTIFHWGTNNPGRNWAFGINADSGRGVVGGLHVNVRDGHVTGSTNLYDGNPHVVACRFSGDNVTDTQLYVDGQLEIIDNSQAQAVDTDASIFTMGRDQAGAHGSGYFYGDIGEVLVLPYDLDDTSFENVYMEIRQRWDLA